MNLLVGPFLEVLLCALHGGYMSVSATVYSCTHVFHSSFVPFLSINKSP